ncbi:tRNA guanosine(34) transglycosylase Tgt [Candidatus Kaiserbacteria bacterium]|nr:tRNA guanosine(34) transglycosylase Tgt [Candidatus Kaiserbacteria bacterium]
MISFEILKQSVRSRARVGILKTPHGEVETPSFVPVATRASVRMLDTPEIEELGSQILICNTFHLHVAPGEQRVADHGGIHGFMKWDKPLMTDSGGFQVFSLGFGSDHGVGKVLKEEPSDRMIEDGTQPQRVRMTEEGVHFKSPVDGTQLFLSPETSIAIQEKLGADIIFAFDECPSPLSGDDYLKRSIERTHRWAQRCIDAKKSDQALYGIVQGGGDKTLREWSAREIAGMDGFQGFGIGGEFGYDKASMGDMLGIVTDLLPYEKPRHVLGIGHPEDFELVAAGGGDTFDCIAPTHYARRRTLFTSEGRLHLDNRAFLDQHEAIDPTCACPVCQTYSRAYVSHLIRANELTGLKLATMHNLHFFNEKSRRVRERIKNDEI